MDVTRHRRPLRSGEHSVLAQPEEGYIFRIGPHKTKTPGTDATVPPTTYDIVLPNLTYAQYLALAQRLALDISQHERNVSITAPSLILMTPQHVIQVSGTGTDYDMTHKAQTITYQIDAEGGASTTIAVKFSSGPL